MADEKQEAKQMTLAERRVAPEGVVIAEIVEGKGLYYDIPSFQNALTRARQHFHIATPINVVPQIPELFALAVRPVNISQDPTSPEWKVDWYRHKQSNAWALRNKALMKFVGARDCSWAPTKFDYPRDEKGNRSPYYVRATATMFVPAMDGSKPRPVSESATMDLRDGSVRASEATSGKELAQRRKFIEEVAEARAKNRCVRKEFALQDGYDDQQAKKGFVVVGLEFHGKRRVVHPDGTVTWERSPKLEEMVAARALGITDDLYGARREEPKPSKPVRLGVEELEAAGALATAMDEAKAEEAIAADEADEDDIPF